MMADKLVQVYRNRNSRITQLRRLVPANEREYCTWCGQPARFQYGWVSDDTTSQVDLSTLRQFCGIKCYDAWRY